MSNIVVVISVDWEDRSLLPDDDHGLDMRMISRSDKEAVLETGSGTYRFVVSS